MATPGPEPRGLIVRPVHPIRPWVIGLAYWAALIPATIAPRHSGNVWSRYMTVESLVERGTLAVDRSPLLRISGTPDLVRVDGHLYSDKPPLLSAMAACVYLPMVAGGVRMAGSPEQFAMVNLVLVSSLVGACSGLALVGLRRTLQAVAIPRWSADLLTLAFGFGSLLLTYGVTFNNHGVAVGLLTMALADVLLEPAGARRPGRRFATGLLSGLAAAIDLPAGGTLMVGLAIWLGVRSRRPPIAFLAGVALPLLAHALLQLAITGSPLPAEMTPEAFAFRGSYWTTGAGAWVENGPRWRFGLELLVGPQGWLTVTPVLALGLVGLIRIALKPGDPLRPLAWTVGATVAVLLVFYTWGVRRTDFAGLSFGTRHLLAIGPAVYAFAVAALARWRGRAMIALFCLLWAVGLIYAVAGMLDPWSRIERREEPPLRVLQQAVLYPRTSYTR